MIKAHSIYWDKHIGEINYIVNIIRGQIHDINHNFARVRIYPIHAGLKTLYTDIFSI